MSKFFGLLKDDDEIKPSALPQPEKAASPAPQPVPGIQLNTSPLSLGTTTLGVVNVTGQVDENLRQMLLKALTDAKVGSPNYLDFKSSLEKTGAILTGLPEDKIYVTVFSTLSTAGATVDKLIQSGKAYLAVLESEKTEFDETMESHNQSEVVTRQNKIDALEEDSKAKTQQIQDLTDAIQQNQVTSQTLRAEMIVEGNKIEVTTKNFEVTEQLIVTQINDDLDKITKYLLSVTS